MPGPDLILPGFHGKLPSAGDFVTRRLPPDFVRIWDRWAARHLVPRLAGDRALFFVLAGPVSATGIAVPSADRSGRRFPLTLAAALPPYPAMIVESAAPWFAALAEVGRAAAAGGLGHADLDARLMDLPLPDLPAGPLLPPLQLWTSTLPARAVDPEAPGPALEALLAAPAEAG